MKLYYAEEEIEKLYKIRLGFLHENGEELTDEEVEKKLYEVGVGPDDDPDISNREELHNQFTYIIQEHFQEQFNKDIENLRLKKALERKLESRTEKKRKAKYKDIFQIE